MITPKPLCYLFVCDFSLVADLFLLLVQLLLYFKQKRFTLLLWHFEITHEHAFGWMLLTLLLLIVSITINVNQYLLPISHYVTDDILLCWLLHSTLAIETLLDFHLATWFSDVRLMEPCGAIFVLGQEVLKIDFLLRHC